jgi:hypothetical protein
MWRIPIRRASLSPGRARAKAKPSLRCLHGHRCQFVLAGEGPNQGLFGRRVEDALDGTDGVIDPSVAGFARPERQRGREDARLILRS